MYVNDIPTAISGSTAYLFANDTKIAKWIIEGTDMDELKMDINSLLVWEVAHVSASWQMHNGPLWPLNLSNSEYSLDRVSIKFTNMQCDLDICLSAKPFMVESLWPHKLKSLQVTVPHKAIFFYCSTI